MAPSGRHSLGTVLSASGRGAEAQKVWEEALRRHPENAWALSGLAEKRCDD
jgi:cytochrome c-type biogenesis protein CcmH/NrfG